jgi:hypothetical protein
VVTGALVGLVEGTAVVGFADGSGPTLGEAVTEKKLGAAPNGSANCAYVTTDNSANIRVSFILSPVC